MKKVCILKTDSYIFGLEYLDLYPEVYFDKNPISEENDLWIDEPYSLFSHWITM